MKILKLYMKFVKKYCDEFIYPLKPELDIVEKNAI